MIAYLGTGLLGANFTKALLQKGESVQVWNRTASKAKALETFGAKAFEDVSDAVKSAERIHLTLMDDASVDEVLLAASKGFSPGVIIIDHTTTTEKGAIQRTLYWKEKGYTYVHAPVFMGPVNALESSGYMLISGDQEVVHKVEPWLNMMTGKLLNFGEVTGKAAGMKLLGNLFLISLTGGISDMLALAKALKIPSSDLVTLFTEWNPGAQAPGRLKRMIKGDFDEPSWELQMARKDARLMNEEAANGNMKLVATPAIGAEMDKWIEKGLGHKDWTVIAKDNL